MACDVAPPRRRARIRLRLACLLLLLLGGCSHSAAPDAADHAKPPAGQPAGSSRSASGLPRAPAAKVVVAQARRQPPSRDQQPAEDSAVATGIAGAKPDPPAFRPEMDALAPHELPPQQPLPAVDSARLADAGIRQIDGAHLTLFTDLPKSPEIDELPQVFDAAVALWCEYFCVPQTRAATWKIVGYVMDRRERFQATGLLPDDLPPFRNGYQRGDEVWLYEQPSAYYRRHMLLHEGTHAFMSMMLAGCGPPWYMEGMAELLATHRWQDGHLQLRYFPQRRDEVEQWGRIKIVRTEVAADRFMSLEQILAYGPTAHLDNEPYAWCWAAAAFLDGHPAFAARFRQLSDYVNSSAPSLSERFWQTFAADRRQLVEQWQLFATQVDYGYDLAREAIVYEPPGAEFTGVHEVRVQADRGWQSSGLRVAAGVPYRCLASGRYQVAREPQVWWCEPGGVTIRYVAGRPLGMLLGAVGDLSQPLTTITPLIRPVGMGLEAEITFPTDGTLFLRINDAPSGLADNSGELVVRIERASPPSSAGRGSPD